MAYSTFSKRAVILDLITEAQAEDNKDIREWLENRLPDPKYGKTFYRENGLFLKDYYDTMRDGIVHSWNTQFGEPDKEFIYPAGAICIYDETLCHYLAKFNSERIYTIKDNLWKKRLYERKTPRQMATYISRWKSYCFE